MESQKSEAFALQEKYFENKEDKEVLMQWLKLNTFIEPKFVSRQEFEELGGDFLVNDWVTEKGVEKSNIYLPNDLRVWELPWIILRINKKTYWDNISENAEANNVKLLIEKAILELSRLKKQNLKASKEKKINKAITKYTKLLLSYFPDANLDNLKSSNPNKELLKNKVKLKQIRQLSELRQEITVGQAEQEIDAWLSDNLKTSLDTSIFEDAKQNLYKHMQTFSQDDKDKVDTDDDIKFSRYGFVDKFEQSLKNRLGIEEYIWKLNKLRNSNDKQGLVELEKEVSEKILRFLLKNYPWNNSYEAYKDAWNSSPARMLESKTMVCVWKSILAHSFLEELWIKHYWANLPGHSALVVELSDW